GPEAQGLRPLRVQPALRRRARRGLHLGGRRGRRAPLAGQPHRDRRLQRPAGRRQVHPDALDGAGHRQVRGLRLDRPPLRRPRRPRGPRDVALQEGRRGGVGASPREADREPPRTDGGERTMNRTTPTQDLRSGAMSADLAEAGQRAISAPLGHALVEAAQADERIVGLSADLAKYTDLHIFRDAMPERFYQIGMAEQALLGAATGLAMEGYVPFASTYSVFATRRAYDFLLLDIAEANLNVNLVCALPGLTTGYG